MKRNAKADRGSFKEMKKTVSANMRISSLDLMRGIAVLLMVQQHTGYWFWNAGGGMSSLIDRYPVMVTINGLGGLAAPLFILLAGSGAALSLENGNGAKRNIVRGFALILSGYILNILTPAWFSPSSWYVLHLIGLGLCVSPFLRVMNNSLLFAIASVITAAAVIFLTYYNIPRYLSNDDMRGTFTAAGIIRNALAGGHFPVFPWMALFITGFVSGRWICRGEYRRIIITAAAILACAVTLILISKGNFGILNNSAGKRLLMVNLYMYPAYPVQFLALSAVSLAMVYFALIAEQKFRITEVNILALTGRVSLTVFILHIIIIRNFMVSSGLWQTFSLTATVSLQIAVIALILIAARYWSRRGFRYGFEWLLRRIAG